MSSSLPTDPASARSLTAVLPQVIASLDGRPDWFAPARSAIVAVVDGLGSANLSARAGHARFLSAARGRKDVARTVFPSTTAAALTSLLTGTDAGQHGIVGYRVRIPGTDTAPTQLRGWETDGLDPRTWQRSQPILERESDAGRPCFVVSRAEYAHSGLTEAILRGAAYVPAEDLSERAEVAAALAGQHPGALIYLYVPELDGLGHRHGWESDAWIEGLEEVDAAAAGLVRAVPSDTGVLVTADHGMVDVPSHRHVLLGDGHPLTDGLRVIAGEPRMLHLHAEPGAAEDLLRAWRDGEAQRSWVLSREEAVTAGLFGSVDDEVLPRIGDVLVAARSGVAYYDGRLADKGPQKMVGQHGSLTPEERVVPLVRLGAFAG